MSSLRILQGDALDVLRTMPEESVNCVVTSPPYWGLRDYGVDGQIGLEATPEEFVERMVEIFREVRRVLRRDGTLWLNLGDSYSAGTRDYNSFRRDRAHVCPPMISEKWRGLPPKNLVGIPWRVALALQTDGWWLRSDIVWHKPNPMPESAPDRPSKAHEYVFLMTKSARYIYDGDAVREPIAKSSIRRLAQNVARQAGSNRAHGGIKNMKTVGSLSGRNLRTVWTVPTQAFSEAHFATFPEKLVEPCIKAGCPVGGVVMDPFCGSGTVGVVAARLGRDFVGVELNPEYIEIARRRIEGDAPLFNAVEAK